MKKTLLLVDGRNFSAAARGLSIPVDFDRLRAYAATLTDGPLIASYYTTRVDRDVRIVPFLRRVAACGFEVIERVLPSRSEHPDDRVRGSCDVDIASQAAFLIGRNELGVLILASGDADFAPLLRLARANGVKTIVLSTMKTRPRVVSSAIVAAADSFIDLDDVRDHVVANKAA